ncbi:metal-dependent hydrolase [Sebaldella sp. S0638]|uniref:metal-dependent hydrolase n=1 Tax=Sebaldella sp. S0638 TaxID=2957809 RepID=UPI00209F7E0E|nr:metal-dependent hydrolase [Sebaldella sp. S0638]MCP1223209.1 metal-dependent hydrolase [Sebaldella sp. S0638]
MKIKFLGQSCFLIETNGKNIITDPFLKDNPKNPTLLKDIPKLDLILITHAHSDHVGDAVELALRDDAVIVTGNELAKWLANKGVKVIPTGIGGRKDFDFVSVKFTQAIHSSSINDNGQMLYGGLAAGILIYAEGKTIYHAGDTALFLDMKLIGETNKIDYAILPIGDNFTMGIDDSVTAAEWLGAKHYIPMHYNTFPLIEQNPEEWLEKIETAGLSGKIMNYGDILEI